MPTAWGYVRVSTNEQANSGLGIEAQRAVIERFYFYKLELQGYVWGGCLVDSGISGSTKFNRRARGRELDAMAQSGDALIFAKVDRAFRDFLDCVNTIEVWEQRGLKAHFLDIGISTDCETGKAMLRMLAVFAALERAKICERTRDAKRAARARGQPTNQYPGYGTRLVSGPDGKPQAQECQTEVDFGRRIVELHDGGMIWAELYRLAQRERWRTWRGQEWSIDRIKRVYAWVKALPGQTA